MCLSFSSCPSARYFPFIPHSYYRFDSVHPSLYSSWSLILALALSFELPNLCRCRTTHVMIWPSESMCAAAFVWVCGSPSTFLKLTTGAHSLSLSLWVLVHPSFLFRPSHSLSICDAKLVMVPHHWCHDPAAWAHVFMRVGGNAGVQLTPHFQCRSRVIWLTQLSGS